MTTTVFHEGELAVQRRAGVERTAAQVGRNILPYVPPEFGAFLARQPFVVLAGRDQADRVWASLLVGRAGFARVLDGRRVAIDAAPAAGDPLEQALRLPVARVGVLAIEFESRARIRLNGEAQRTEDGILLKVEEAFGNCPKFIQRRLPNEALGPTDAETHRETAALDSREAALITRADTFFIASFHPERGADASHRGGRPGFVEVSEDRHRVTFPDYSGNRMFQTLGNLAVNPRAGLLFVDWETGTALQLTGEAQILWDEDEVSRRPGAERVVGLTIDAVREHEGAMPARWKLVEPSRLNPPIR